MKISQNAIYKYVIKILKMYYRRFKNLKGQIDKSRFDFTVNHTVKTEESIRKLIEIRGKKLSNEIKNHMNSDTIFILGSGPSINNIDKEHWQYIQKHDSIGFNYWLAHEFVPTFYMMQAGNSDSLQNLLHDKRVDYRNVPFMIRGSWLTKNNIDYSFLEYIESKHLYYINEYAIYSKCDIEPQKLINFFDALDLLNEGKVHPNIPKLYATVTMIMNLCFVMGYKNIVLCGIDMKNSNHFWDFTEYREVKEKYNLPGVDDTNIMMLNDRTTKSYTVPDAIYAQSEFYKSKNGTKVYIANENTVLYPKLQVYFS